MRNWERLVDELIAECRTRGIRNATLKGRERELLRWGFWLKKKSPRPKAEDITAEHITDYIKSRSSFLSRSSVAGIMSHMRVMGEFLVDKGVWLENPLRWMNSPKLHTNYRKIPKTYHRADLQKIFEESFNAQGAYFRALFPAIISIYYTTGMRKSELMSLKLTDWNREERTLKVMAHKTGIERITPVSDEVWRCLENYIKARDNKLLQLGISSDYLFVNSLGRKVNGTTLLVQLRRIADRAGVKRATIQMFRHSCATGLIEEGVPLPQVQQILGHSHIVTTFRYLSVSDPMRKQAIAKHPINSILDSLKGGEDASV